MSLTTSSKLWHHLEINRDQRTKFGQSVLLAIATIIKCRHTLRSHIMVSTHWTAQSTVNQSDSRREARDEGKKHRRTFDDNTVGHFRKETDFDRLEKTMTRCFDGSYGREVRS
jgi:hypothetical protein